MREKIYILCWMLFMVTSITHAQEVLNNNWITNGPVYAVTQNTTNTYVGGNFDLVGVRRPNGVLFNTDTGNPTSTQNFPDRLVSSSAPDGQGGFFIAGTTDNSNLVPSFTQVGTTLRDGLAHILSTGEVSGVFNPVLAGGRRAGKIILAATSDRVVVGTRSTNPVTRQWESRIYCLALDGSIVWERNITNGGEATTGLIANGTLYIAGRFLGIEGQPRTRAAAFDLATGNLLQWNTGSRIPFINALIRNPIWLGISGDEMFIRYAAPAVAGVNPFFSVDRVSGASTGWSLNVGWGQTLLHHDRIYYSTGNFGFHALDALTKTQLPIPSTISFNNVTISALVADGEMIYVGGPRFIDNNGVRIGSVFRFNENTLEVETLNAQMFHPIESTSLHNVYTLSVGGGQMYVGGYFPSIAMQPVTHLFGYNRQSGELLPFTPSLNGTVTHLQAFDSRLYLNGFFFEADGQARHDGTACYNLDNNQVTAWQLAGSAIVSLARWNDRLYASGYSGLLAFDANTEQPLNWTAQMSNESFSCTTDDNGVYAVGNDGHIHFLDHGTGNPIHPPLSNGGILTSGLVVANNRLFITGEFDHLGEGANLVANNGLGVVDLSTGLPIAAEIVFNPAADWAKPMSIATDGATVYLGGQFQQVNALPRNKTAAINSETLQPTDWTVSIEADLGAFTFPVNSIYAFQDGIFIAGNFDYANGTPIKNLAVVSPDRSNVVSGIVFRDDNGNGTRDTGEPGIPNLLMEVQPGNLYYPTDTNGNYTLYTGVGDYTIQPVHPTYALSVTPGVINISFNDDLLTSTGNNFAVVPLPSLTDDEIEIVSDRAPRPGFEYEYTVSYRNSGTINSSGTVTVAVDPRLTIENTTPPATNSEGNNLSWTYTNVMPGENRQIIINARVPAPTIDGSLLGETLVTSATITPSVADNDISNNNAALEEIVIGSVDPNDKLVTPQGYGPNGYIDENTEHLTYTIRFQNVGTAPAENIYLNDILDLNLDISSFQVIESSHPGFSYYINNRTLHVSYLTINLEDSVSNEPASHGFFTFRINLNPGLPRGTVIQNSASIIFDYNLPLETNIVTNTLRNAPYPTMIFVPTAEAMIGSTISMPVMAYNFQNVMGTQFSVSWNPEVVSFESIEGLTLPGQTETSFGLGNTGEGYLTFAWSDPSLALQSIPDSTALFHIRFRAVGSPGEESPVSISQVPTALEVVGENYLVMESERNDGRVVIMNTVVANGAVTYPNGEPVQNVTINVTGSATLSTYTNAAGEYSVTVEPEDADAAYTFTPGKTNDPGLLNGTDVYDVAAIRRHILQTETLNSPFAIIAADVSNNQNVSIQDVLILQALILDVEEDFPAGRQWTFIAATHEFEEGTSPFGYPQTITPDLEELGVEEHNFIGVKIGDINFSRDNSQTGRLRAQEVVFEIGKPVEIENGTVEVDVRSFGFIDISAFQFTVQWNVEQLRFVETITNEITPLFGSHRTNEGFLTTIWDEPNGESHSITESSSLMKMRFEKIGQPEIDNISITSSITPIKMYDQDLNEVSLTFREGEEERIESGYFYPNPFISNTKISFSASETQQAVFEVVDAMGRRKQVSEIAVRKGWNEFVFDGATLSEGVYIFKLQLKEKQVKAKIIKRKH